MMIRVSLYLWALGFCIFMVLNGISTPRVSIMFNPETDGPIEIERKAGISLSSSSSATSWTITTIGSGGASVICTNCSSPYLYAAPVARDALTIYQQEERESR